MIPGPQTSPPVVSRAALSGLGVGAAASSFLGARIFAGFAAVALAVGVVLALRLLVEAGRVIPALGALSALLFPLATVDRGEAGILWAAAASVIVLAAGYVTRGQRPGNLRALAVTLAVVLHLGLLGSYLVLAAAAGNRLLPALVLMAAAFEAAYAIASARTRTGAKLEQKRSGRGRPAVPAVPSSGHWIDVKAAIAAVAATQVAALATRFFLPSPLGVVSCLVLGAAVGAGAILGHASAVAVAEDLRRRRPGQSPKLDLELVAHLNALLFAAGTFYYGFRLYVA